VKLHESILQTLKELNFTHMTPVQVTLFTRLAICRLLRCLSDYLQVSFSQFQAACIPLFMSNKDVAAEAVSI